MRPLLLLLSMLSFAFAPAPLYKPNPAEDDLGNMQGEWVLAYAHEDGVREELTQASVWAIEGDRLSTSLDGKRGSTCFITLDGRTRPRSIDLRKTRDGADPAPGRYGLEGDTLTVCIGGKRPRDLSGYGPSNGVWVFEREKP